MFVEKIRRIAPVLENDIKQGRTSVKKYSNLVDIRKKTWEELEVPYIAETISFLEENKGAMGRRLLVATDNLNVAVKAMAYIRVHMDEYYEDDGCYYGYDCDFDEDETDVSDMVRIIDLAGIGNDEKMPINKYLHLLNEVRSDDMVVFTGITDETDIKEKLDVVCACPAVNVCVHIKQDLLNQNWVQMLRIDYQFDVLKLTTPDNKYFEKCVKCLLDNENVKLSKDLPVNRLVQFVYKNKGNDMKEEALAWYMDMALSNCLKRGKQKIIKSSDFGNLLGSLENPLEELNKMTGLDNLKKTAMELSALTKEELKNAKLGVMHKNMIFVGNPGTGKTTGAKILADIMAWEGNANSKFIVADRSKIIGKYVGHTAPKVAGLFEEANGGVLFVDEAGFFLNIDSGGYVEEAIKEFVRYMELYPNVMVIFAMYNDEIKDFLNLDCGLTSRISKFVKFDDYNNDELIAITTDLLKKKGYVVNEVVVDSIRQGITKLNKEKIKAFGNARGARNLAESIIIMSAKRRYKASNDNLDIQPEDVKKATDRLQKEIRQKNNTFGFGNEGLGKSKLAF